MPNQNREVSPGPDPRTVRADGQILRVPDDWELLPPGDPGLTRRVKAGGPTWTVMVPFKRRMTSAGVWAPTARIEAARRAVGLERLSPAYQKRLAADRQRREKAQEAYVEDFRGAVLAFLRFAPAHAAAAEQMADAVTTHATPVGSGTVARTQRIPVEERAEAAVIAWMRHQTTAYDDMPIPRVKGARREVRRMLAERSRRLLEAYRKGDAVDAAKCPLQRALRKVGAG